MARYTIKMNKEEFLECVKDILCKAAKKNSYDMDIYSEERYKNIEEYIKFTLEHTDLEVINPKMEDDISKIIFHFENSIAGCDESKFGSGGFHVYERDGVCLIMCGAGGDWEQPVFFVIYVDNKKKLRAYIPSKGNTYCKTFKCAWGSIGEYGDSISDEELENFNEKEEDLDIDLFLDDAFSRIVIKE